MSSTGADAGAVTTRSPGPLVEALEDVVPGIRLILRVPPGARAEPESGLPSIDVSGLAGASVKLRRGFVTEDGLILRAACVTGPSDRWAPGVEELVFGRASAIAARAAPGSIERWELGPIRTEGRLIEQRLSGVSRRDGAAFAAEGRHILGFAGEARDVVLCTLVCAERASEPRSTESPSPAPAPAKEPVRRCAELVAAASPSGVFLEAPPPSAPVRLILLAAEHPEAAGVVSAAIFVLVVVVILARRPRPKP